MRIYHDRRFLESLVVHFFKNIISKLCLMSYVPFWFRFHLTRMGPLPKHLVLHHPIPQCLNHLKG